MATVREVRAELAAERDRRGAAEVAVHYFAAKPREVRWFGRGALRVALIGATRADGGLVVVVERAGSDVNSTVHLLDAALRTYERLVASLPGGGDSQWGAHRVLTLLRAAAARRAANCQAEAYRALDSRRAS